MRIVLLLLFTFSLYAKETLLVSILPQKYFLEQLVGNNFQVKTLIPPGANPATYSLKPSDLQIIKKAAYYFTIGVPFEKANISRITSTNPNLKLIDTTKYIRLYPMQAHHHEAHDHEDHRHSGLDPHVWLAPNLAIQIARSMLDTLLRIDAAHKDLYLNNYERFAKETLALDKEIYTKLIGIKNRSFLVFHPSFGYFARSYNLEQIAIEQEGKEPKIKDLLKLLQKAKAKGIKKVIIEPQFPKRSAKIIAQKLGAKVVVIDPLAYDWQKSLKSLADAISH